MNVLELFSGTASFSNVAKQYFGHDTFTIDNQADYEPDLVEDILELNFDAIPFIPDIIWASPPCTTYSVASFPAGHRDKGQAISQDAIKADELVKITLAYIREIKPQYWIIENPVGLLRKMSFMENIPRMTVTYCQYGTTNMKKTDLFGKLPDCFIPRKCKNGDPCHEEARRGAKTGTQGLDKKDRSKIPFKLCWEILNAINKEES